MSYTKALEERVAQLENLLAAKGSERSDHATPSELNQPPVASDPGLHGGDIGGSGKDTNAVNDIVGIISLGNFEAPAYVGPSAGLSLAMNLGEMVQATTWKKAIPGVQGEALSPGASEVRRPLRGVRAMSMDELARYSIKEPPSDELGSRLVTLYLQQLHTRYPFLDPTEIWRLQKERAPITPSAASSGLSMTQRYGIFKLYMVFAIGATLLQLTNKSIEVSPERFYMTALQHMAAAKVPRTVQNIEAMTLLVVYHLRSTSGLGLWYMIGLAMRTCIDLGIHRKSHERGLPAHVIQMHRRLFWTVYSLEIVIAISLGRPLSISERQIDVELPDSIPMSSAHPSSPEGSPSQATSRNDSLQLAILLFRLRIIEARIHNSIYRTDKPLSALRPKLDKIYKQLEAWKLSSTESLPHDGHVLDYPLLLYHRAVRMLIQPFMTILPVTDPYYVLCLRAAGNICQMHKRLHQTISYGHSFIAVQTIFVAGVTLLYGLWTQTHLAWSVTLADDLRACSLVLFVMSERAPWVRKYRDAFEVLVDAAMEKLRRSSGEASLVEMVAVAQQTHAQQQQQQSRSARGVGGVGGDPRVGQFASGDETMMMGVLNLGFMNHTGSAGTSSSCDNEEAHGGDGENNSDVWRLVTELASWIDQDQETTPKWMPNFEALQNLSSNEPQ